MVYRRNRPRRRNPAARKRRNFRRRARWAKKRKYHVRPSMKTIPIMPDKLRMKLKLFDYGTWQIQGSQVLNYPRSTANGLGTTYYQSSCWKPIQWSNHYQHYVEQIQQIYAKYRVLGIKYRLRVYSTQINQTTWVGVISDTGFISSTSGVSWNQWMEDPRTYFKSMGSVNSGRATTVLKGYLDVAKTFGKSVQAVQDEEEFAAFFGSNPAKCAYLNPVVLTTWPETTEPPNGMSVDFEMWMTYYVQMEDRIMALSIN